MPTFANTIDGNEILAKRAERDYAGNDIQQTYATKSEVTTGLSAKEDASNKAQSINTSSTTDFPSSKATADFVNSSVATNTAKFLGNYTLTDLSLTYPATDAQIETALDGYAFSPAPTNNDYVYVEIQDPQTPGVADVVKRFKFDGANWLYEYALNNSSFTAGEIAAIDSGITSTKVGNYDTHIADTTIHVTSTDKSTWDAKQDAISDLATIRSGAALGATSVQPGDLATVATTGAYSDLSGTPTIVDNGKIYGMDGTESYNDIYTKMVVDGIGITWVLNRVSPYTGKATYTACEITSNDSSNTYGYLRLTCVMRAGTASQQITVFIAEAWGNANGFGTPTYSLSSTPIGLENQVYSWNSNGIAIARNISEVPSYTTSEDGKVLGVVDNSGTASLEWITPAAGGVTDVEVDGTSVVSGGVASITMPTVDQTYDGTSANAQSGVAVASAISTKQDTISDLATIRSGAADGATAVQPGDLATVATSGLYSDLSGTPTIPSGSDLVPPYSLPTDEGKVLTVGPSTTYWATPAAGGVTDVEVDGVSVVSGGVASITTPTVDQVYDGTSTNAQSGTAVAGAIAGVNQVPASTSADSGKVLTVNAQGVPGWVTGGGGGGVQSDWTEADPTSMAYIENKPTPKTLTAGDNVTITETSSTITVSASWQNDEVVLYSGMQTIGNDGAATYNLSELPTNFQYIRIYYCASDNTFSSSINGNVGVGSTEWDTTIYTAPNTAVWLLMNGSGALATMTAYTVQANLHNIRTASWSVNGFLNAATGNAKWFHIYKIVGIHRIAND